MHTYMHDHVCGLGMGQTLSMLGYPLVEIKFWSAWSAQYSNRVRIKNFHDSTVAHLLKMSHSDPECARNHTLSYPCMQKCMQPSTHMKIHATNHAHDHACKYACKYARKYLGMHASMRASMHASTYMYSCVNGCVRE